MTTTNQELLKWLKNPKKPLEDRLEFAVKAWNSSELISSNKYNTIFEWLNEFFCTENIKEDGFCINILGKLMKMQCRSGLLAAKTKEELYKSILKLYTDRETAFTNRNQLELFFNIIEHSAFEIYLLNSAELFTTHIKVFATNYNSYFDNLLELTTGNENAFIVTIFKKIKNCIDKISKFNEYKIPFIKNTLYPLIQMILKFKKEKIELWPELFEIEEELFYDMEVEQFINLSTTLSDFMFAQIVEVYIKINQYEPQKFGKLFQYSFAGRKFLNTSDYTKTIGFIIKLLKKYDVKAKFNISDQEFKIYMQKEILKLINNYSQIYPEQIILICCNIIELDPMILEPFIFKITPKFIFLSKSTAVCQIYEKYMILVLKMYQKLGRGEKFVNNLLKSVKDELNTVDLSKTPKRTLEMIEERPNKLRKNNDGDIEEIFQNNNQSCIYLDILITDIPNEIDDIVEIKESRQWEDMRLVWPHSTVGLEFSKFMSSLMAKPSLVVWQTLIYSITDCINNLNETISDANTQFLLSFNTILLCEYLSSTRLLQQTDKFCAYIIKNHDITYDMLKKFGHKLLNMEHNIKIMNNFLEICYNVGNFDITLGCYHSDEMTAETKNFLKTVQTLHNYMTKEEWLLFEQRILNFGKKYCKANMNRLNLQKLKIEMLNNEKSNFYIDIKTNFLSSTYKDKTQLKFIFFDNNNTWLLNYINRDDKLYIFKKLKKTFCSDPHLIRFFTENNDFFEIILIGFFKNISKCIHSKKSLYKSIDFNDIIRSINNEHITELMNILTQKSSKLAKRKYCHEEINKVMKYTQASPIGYIRSNTKLTIILLILILYKDLEAVEDDKLQETCFDILQKIIVPGEELNIFKFLSIDFLLKTFPPTSTIQLYKLIFNNLNQVNRHVVQCLENIADLLDNNGIYSEEDIVELSIVIIETVGHQHSFNTVKMIITKIIKGVMKYININLPLILSSGDMKNEFLVKTISVLTSYLNKIFIRDDSNQKLNEKLINVYKTFITRTVNISSMAAIKLLNISIIYRDALGLTSNEIQMISDNYLTQLKEDLHNESDNQNNFDLILKIIINNKSNNEFEELLMDLLQNIERLKYDYVCKLLYYISRIQLNATKGMIFSNYFKCIIFNITTQIKRKSSKDLLDYSTILRVLETQHAICRNKQMPISSYIIDDILSFLTEINIKIFSLSNNRSTVFFDLHTSMSDICSTLIKYRSEFISDRMPQFIHIFKDLLIALCWYKCDREAREVLNKRELENLEELGYNMEKLMRLIATKSLDMKKVAPYLLVYTISLMVKTRRPTTLYPKIKRNFENICFEIISVQDYRVKNYILRVSDDATKQIYKSLCEEYKKHHKFRGKV